MTAKVSAKHDLAQIAPTSRCAPIECAIRKNRSQSDQTGKGYFLMPHKRPKCATEQLQCATAGAGTSCSGDGLFDTNRRCWGYRRRCPNHGVPITALGPTAGNKQGQPRKQQKQQRRQNVKPTTICATSMSRMQAEERPTTYRAERGMQQCNGAAR